MNSQKKEHDPEKKKAQPRATEILHCLIRFLKFQHTLFTYFQFFIRARSDFSLKLTFFGSLCTITNAYTLHIAFAMIPPYMKESYYL